MTDFNKELALVLLNSSEEFPVDFDEAWQWLGYATKQKAQRKLEQHFEECVDFITKKSIKTQQEGTRTISRPYTEIRLTIACFEKMKSYRRENLPKCNEKLIQQKLHEKKRGQIEVATPVGNIDLLTSSELIEIKDKNNWKSALGQVIAYGYYYPSHRKVIYLFGNAHSKFKETVEEVCRKNNVYVRWVNDSMETNLNH